ncbi:glycosyltransferase [Brevibacillus borstelensis]|uniref:glycosyltransferase n=1 Tax=Brevibacillus borstelensis TaxID=45462 RepID=UPI002E1F4BDF|nr:glycosyltransferase [Brevibacillus borstelensis]MED1852255.1 glycosyltransferase [Brevibacillus borstelensis]
MNIAFDMTFSQNVSNVRGIGRYSKSLLEHIALQSGDHSFFYFYPDLSVSHEQLREQLQLFIRQNKIDLFHILSPFEWTNFAMMNREWYGKTRVAATLYDMIPWIYQHIYLSNPQYREFYRNVLEFVKSCDIIFAISEATKQDAVKLAGMDPEKIHVVMGGMNEQFTCIPNCNQMEVNSRYGIRKPYVMCTSGMDFRKNTDKLIEGFAKANQALHFSYQLVLCCDVSPTDVEHLKKVAQNAGTADDLIITGYVPDSDLVKLYNGAALFAFPSLYEGFGLPVLEAMACGVPVVTSNNSSLAEIAGDAAYLINPHSTDEIASGIYKMLTSPDLQIEYRKKGFVRAEQFQWSEVARKVMDGYQLVVRKKIAIFSPLPPIHSGIANYMASILPSLLKNYDCDLYIDDGYTPELSDTARTANVYHHRMFPEKADEYDAILYQMGNSFYHAYIIPYLRKYHGVVVLHDLNLHGLGQWWALDKNDLDTYLTMIKEEAKDGDDSLLRAVLSGNMGSQFDHIINKFYINGAKSVVVHNRYCYDALVNDGVESVIMARLPASMPLQSPKNRNNRFVFASFGFSGPHKRLESAIRCIKMLVSKGHDNVEYRIVGSFDSDYANTLKSLVTSLKLQSHVTFLGYLPNEEYYQQLSQADAVINLRYPTCGESSATLLDTLSLGIPSIVSDIGSFREISDEVVLKVPSPLPDDQPLFAAMLKLYQDPDLRQGMSRKAKEYVSRCHSVEQYIEQLNKAIEASS